VAAKCLGGEQGQRLQCEPVSGCARQAYVVAGGIDEKSLKPTLTGSGGGVELSYWSSEP